MTTSTMTMPPPQHLWQKLLLIWQAGDMDLDDDLDQTLAAVGPRLRALRQQRETTLAELSTATGISVSTLSRLESGARRPTLELLLPLARAHGVTLDELAGAPPTGDPRIHLRPVTRHGMTMLPLTRRAGGIQAYKLVIPASSGRREPDLKTHEGYEWVYVLNGRLRLILGDHDLVLSPGEAAEFDTRVPHWFGAADAEPVEFLSLFGRQGERAHLRARPRTPGAGVGPTG
jgi:transcriptional regulator with XRE-family HTH domain